MLELAASPFHLVRRFVASLPLVCLLLLIVAPAVFASPYAHTVSLVGPKKYYLALGDSLAFGYQPDLVFNHGYVDDFYSNLQGRGVNTLANMSCPDESSTTFINDGCPYSYLRKFPYVGSQLNAAIAYLNVFAGQVSPVTLNIGSNDVLLDIDAKTCTVNTTKYAADLATLDTNLTQTILPRLHTALMVNGKVTGDLVLMNYYDPFQNACPTTVSYVRQLNQHLANDVKGYGTMVDVFSAFGGARTPNPNLCTYTWICSAFQDVHSRDKGYSVIAQAIESRVGY